ncbi:MAG: right-handed parallel beta-helix repeat-containing protein, partial [Gammaproteobacteria bacterium]|nr:right-handed parallel beta-helix repeat-containing protein [Gammaproteobacteria bacterium]
TTTTPGELVLTFTDANGEIPTSADVDNILRQLTYANSSDTPPASVQIDWTFSDGNTGAQGSGGALLSAGNMTVNITAANDAPVNTVPAAQVVAEDTALTISGISVNDADGNLSTVQLTVTQGTVTVTLSGSATISAGANDSATLTLSGTQADINATLASLSYQGTLNYTGADTLTVTSTDSNSATDVDVVGITVGLFVDTTSDVSDGDTSSTAALLANKGADGKISLREAIEAANNNAGLDTISFNIADALVGGAHTIDVLSALPTITDAVILDGTTDPDFGSTPIIELDGSATVGAYGLDITAGDSTVRGLVINNFGSDSIILAIGDNNVIAGNYIGTDVTGTLAQGGVGSGIKIWAGSTGNVIGGTVVSDRNVISGNSEAGIEIDGVGSNTIQGNYIGTNAAGTGDLGNGNDGVYISNAGSGNVIGGSVAGAGNVISGNDRHGIFLTGTTTGTTVTGNIIGLDAAGTSTLANSNSGIAILSGANSNTIGGTTALERNIISGNSNYGIRISGAGSDSNVVRGNYIGTDLTGTVDLGNTLNGIRIDSGASSNTIGGLAAGAGNVISGNDAVGILIRDTGTTGNTVLGNYIGTNATGTAAIGNSSAGLRIDLGASGNTVGGTTTSARNVISGNSGDGVYVSDSGTDSNVIQGNFIGTNAAGTAALANTDRGVQIENSASNTQIGGTVAGAGNVISGNSNDGIIISNSSIGTLIEGNFIGTDLTGTIDLGNGTWGVRVTNASGNTIGGTASGAGNIIAYNTQSGIGLTSASGTGNSILGNSIHSNDVLGIDLGVDGVTVNDVGDGDAGANNLQNFPVLFTAHTEGGNTTFTGSLNGIASTDYRIEFYSNTLGMEDATGYGEGQTYLGYATVTTDGSGNATINAVLAVTLVASDRVTATATVDLGGGNYGDTSEFGQNVIATANDVPVITNLGGDTLAYTEGDGAAVIDQSTNAAVTDVDSTDFDTGTLTVSFQAGSDSAEDVLAIQNQGTGAGQIGVSGSNVTYQGVTIGTFTGGSSGTDLVITLNASADATAVSALTQNITYENTDTDNPTTGSRTVRYALTDGDGGTSANYDTTVTFAVANDVPIITNLGGDTLAYSEGDGASVIDQSSNAAVTDVDSSDFDTGTLTVSFTAGSDSAEDVLAIQNQGTGAGQIGVSGSNVTYQGVTIGTFTGGTSGTDLVITLNASADATAVSALTQNITYENTDTDNPTTGSRTVRYALTDGDGGTSANYDTTVTVSATNNGPAMLSLNDNPTFIEDGSAVVLDVDVNVIDVELDALNSGNGNYDGASLTLVRNGGVSSDDVLSFSDGNGITLSGSTLIKNSQIIATFDTTTTPGELVLTFTDANGEIPTSADVDNILRQLTYANSSDTPPASVQ